MNGQKRLVLFVEGPGDLSAGPELVGKIITDSDPSNWGQVIVDASPFKVGGLQNLTGRNAEKWEKWLRTARKSRKDVGGVLLLLDGDTKKWVQPDGSTASFCARDVAWQLANAARNAGGGKIFSVAIVFACCEFESWLIAGIESLAGKYLSDGRPGIIQNATRPAGNLEVSPRNAKGWLSRNRSHPEIALPLIGGICDTSRYVAAQGRTADYR